MRIPMTLLLAALSASVAHTQNSIEDSKFDAKHLPRFEDFPVTETWTSPSAALKLTTSSERMFKTNLTAASQQSPNFAGHYRLTHWGCGSNCAAAALIDLKT